MSAEAQNSQSPPVAAGINGPISPLYGIQVEDGVATIVMHYGTDQAKVVAEFIAHDDAAVFRVHILSHLDMTALKNALRRVQRRVDILEEQAQRFRFWDRILFGMSTGTIIALLMLLAYVAS